MTNSTQCNMDTYREFCIRFWEDTRELDLYSMDGSQLDRLIVDALLKTNGGKELKKTSMNELSVLIRAFNHNNRKIQSPSLSSDLDEAAEEALDDVDANWQIEERDDGCTEPGYNQKQMLLMFKAGAKWMAGQGETHEAEIIESVPFGGTKWKRCVKVWLDDQFQAKGNKVVVQIRKK